MYFKSLLPQKPFCCFFSFCITDCEEILQTRHLLPGILETAAFCRWLLFANCSNEFLCNSEYLFRDVLVTPAEWQALLSAWYSWGCCLLPSGHGQEVWDVFSPKSLQSASTLQGGKRNRVGWQNTLHFTKVSPKLSIGIGWRWALSLI